jgi:multidrug efflux pump subunit AcrA (membrane-fusion protein)
LNAQDQYSLQNSVLDVELKDIALKNTSLYAPFAGVLVSAPTEVAGTIASATDAFLIVNPETMYFSADVDESDISKVKDGMTALIKLDAYPEVEIPVVVNRIAFQSSEASTGTVFGVEFRLPQAFDSVEYRLGMNGDAKISIAKKEDVLHVPVRAITERENKKYVEVKVGDKTEQREVETGLEDDTNVEIISGLEPTNQVLIH